MLSQLDDNGSENPIRYDIRVLCGAESKYSAFEREALRVIFALKKFRHYLISNKFKLYTDHQTLKYVFNMKYPNWADSSLVQSPRRIQDVQTNQQF